MVELLVATTNPGKFLEIKSFLQRKHTNITPLFLREVDPNWQVTEDGNTFFANAKKKALETAKRFQKIVLADDSGLLVDALGGEPGVHSARYAGENASDRDRYEKLLEKMQGIPTQKRTARFEATMVLANPKGETLHETGTLQGSILETPRGEKGFGFDPIFWVPSYKKSLAELEMEEKNQVSHRAQALVKISGHLDDFLHKMWGG